MRNVYSSISITLLQALLIIALHSPIQAQASPFPNLLDDVREDVGSSAFMTALYTSAVAVYGMHFNPLLQVPNIVPVSGRVLQSPKIHNIYLDDDWNAHKPAHYPTVEQLDAFVENLSASRLLAQAGEYGVNTGSFTGSHPKSAACSLLEPISDKPEFIQMILWISCMVSFTPAGNIITPVAPSPQTLPGFFPPISGVPYPDDDTVYSIFLPSQMEFLEFGCSKFTGYHFFGAVPDTHLEPLFLPPFVIAYTDSRTFPFTVNVSGCANSSPPVSDVVFDTMTKLVSHEIIEAATDPIFPLGWINVLNNHNLFTNLGDLIFNIMDEVTYAEASDICQIARPGFPVPGTPALPVDIQINDARLGPNHNYLSVRPFWSNSHAACIPFPVQVNVNVGAPNFSRMGTRFITSTTSITLDATAGGAGANISSISYRIYPTGTAPAMIPAFIKVLGNQVVFNVLGPDQSYTIDYFAISTDGVIQRTPLSTRVTLDNAAPIVSIISPMQLSSYDHADTLVLNYQANDGTGSGIARTGAQINSSSTLAGHGLNSGQVIALLTELPLGTHTFRIDAVDNLGNASAASSTFSVIASAGGIIREIDQFLTSGKIKNAGIANSLRSKLAAALDARNRGQCGTAANIYSSFINEVQAQLGSGVDTDAGMILRDDANYLISHCP